MHQHLLLAEACSLVTGLGMGSCGLMLPEVAGSTLVIMRELSCVSETSFGDVGVGLLSSELQSLLDPKPAVETLLGACVSVLHVIL